MVDRATPLLAQYSQQSGVFWTSGTPMLHQKLPFVARAPPLKQLAQQQLLPYSILGVPPTLSIPAQQSQN
jgi:hypothetical protein